jgi:hypothetical protein
MSMRLTDSEVLDHVRVHLERVRLIRARRLAEVLGPRNAARLEHATSARAFVQKLVDGLRRD